MENATEIYHETLLIVQNREKQEYNALFARSPMVVGRGRTEAEAIIELLTLTNIIIRKNHS